MRLCSIIESKGGPDLYFHYTGIGQIVSILRNDIMVAQNKRRGVLNPFEPKKDFSQNDSQNKFVSFTRAPSDAAVQDFICIVVDANKLRQKYKTVPIFGDILHIYDPNVHTEKPKRESEERVYRDITPIRPLIKCIAIDDYVWRNLKNPDSFFDQKNLHDLYSVLLEFDLPVLIIPEYGFENPWIRKIHNARPFSLMMKGAKPL